jgi:hypothetical protein
MLLAFVVMASPHRVLAEIPTILSDKVQKGSGVIDILRDASSEELSAYLEAGNVYLGVDLNEDAGGNESSESLGVAIEQMELVLTTTNGEFTFDEFYTNTTAMILEEGATEAQEFYTLFGSTGSNEISGSSGFDISRFDDVVEIRNVEYTGDLVGAELRVTFLDTAGGGSNETFFDFSDGFEEFALIESPDAILLDDADIGVAAASSELEYTYYTDIRTAVGAPEPALALLLALPLLLYVISVNDSRHER